MESLIIFLIFPFVFVYFSLWYHANTKLLKRYRIIKNVNGNYNIEGRFFFFWWKLEVEPKENWYKKVNFDLEEVDGALKYHLKKMTDNYNNHKSAGTIIKIIEVQKKEK